MSSVLFPDVPTLSPATALPHLPHFILVFTKCMYLLIPYVSRESRETLRITAQVYLLSIPVNIQALWATARAVRLLSLLIH